jgi:hypothetical protein
MNARRFVTVAALLLATWNAVEADSVSWISGETPPRGWEIQPAVPTTADVIAFSGPTKVYSNSCVGERVLGGTPQVSVDNASKTVTLWFQGPAPAVCTADYRPVCGLQGDFGPLEAGDWKFISLSRELPFEVRFTVAGKAVHHVDADAPGPAHDGKTWMTAFLTLQDGLAAAVSGDDILVAEGTYKPDGGAGFIAGDREASFELKNGVTVKGGYAGYGQPDPDARDIATYRTVLSGDLNSDDLWGILYRDDNSYHVLVGLASGETATLDGFSVVKGNANGVFPNDLGGGMYNPGGTLMIVNCTLQGNTGAFGGAILNLAAPLTLVNTQLIGNRAFVSGGGLYNWEGDAVLHNCRIVGNTADRAEDIGGAAINNLTGNLTILDSTIADNLSSNGEAVTSFSWDWDAAGAIEVANSILYNGGKEIWSNNLSTVGVTYSDVQAGWAGTGNISTAPLFVAPGARSIEGEWIDGDYHLQATSPCIDAGSDGEVPSDVADLNDDGNVAEQLPVDLDGTARIQGTAVDMGAYEQLAKKPGPGPGVTLTFLFSNKQTVLTADPVIRDTYNGSVKVEIESNLKLQLFVDVTATSPAGGMWTGWTDPDTVSPPGGTVTLYVKGENLDLAALPPGSTTVQVAEAEISGAIIP